jgi:glutathione S-transferase
MTIQLHHDPGSAAMIPHILLHELGERFELVPVSRAERAHKQPAYLRLNPNGLIPVLVDGDLVLYETAAIVLHLCDTHAEAQLAPAVGTPERAHFYKWLVWLTNTLQPTLLAYFYPERWVDEGDAAAAQVKRHAERKVAGLLAQLEAELARHGQPWFGGAAFSALDPYVFTLCRWTRNFKNEQPARAYPLLGEYLQRVLARPAVQRVFATEQLSPPFV